MKIFSLDTFIGGFCIVAIGSGLIVTFPIWAPLCVVGWLWKKSGLDD